MSICVIPAKGTSRRIPRKNLRPFHGKPILAYSIEIAQASELFDRIIVSTDDEEIASVSQRYGAEAWRRGPALCEDIFGPLDVVGSVLFKIGNSEDLHPEYACCLTATAPLTLPQDLIEGLAELQKRPDANFSFGMGTEPPKDSGSWYWGRSKAFINAHPLVATCNVMVPMPAHRYCDINEESDWLRAESLYADIQRRAA